VFRKQARCGKSVYEDECVRHRHIYTDHMLCFWGFPDMTARHWLWPACNFLCVVLDWRFELRNLSFEKVNYVIQVLLIFLLHFLKAPNHLFVFGVWKNSQPANFRCPLYLILWACPWYDNRFTCQVVWTHSAFRSWFGKFCATVEVVNFEFWISNFPILKS